MNILTTPDILIIGAGSAGVAAAVGAGSAGASVVLLEKNGFPGGKATAAYVGTVCGLYYRSENPVSRLVNNGFPESFAGELMERSKIKPVLYKDGLHFLPYSQFQFMRICDELAKKNTDALCFHSHVIDAAVEDNKITSVDALYFNKRVRFFPKAIIDTSGEAVIASTIPLDAITSDQYQAAAQVFVLSGLADSSDELLGMSLLRSIKKGISDGSYNPEHIRLSVVPGSVRNGQVLLKLGIPLRVDNDPAHITDIELFSRKAIEEILVFLKQHNELFKNAHLAMIAPEAGIRTGPRHKGKSLLNESDVMNCIKSVDSIARGAWPIEYWEPGKNPEMGFFEMDNYYDIPAGALQSYKIENLFFAGRNISADDKAIASARVIGTCLATGYAAGKLAAGFVKKQSTDATLSAIRNELFAPTNVI
ncbi:MAG: FAD-dependent oxidoreductase [Bacteroidetes bacterium]|nr:FAD-dependent oxidoreductase [Bacteroidota bacterium]